MSQIADWGNLTGPELTRWSRQDPVVLLPIAAVEQHGPHLPLATDIIIGTGIVQRALDMLAADTQPTRLLKMPCLALGSSLEHSHFPGTVSLSAKQMTDQIRAVGAAIARAGMRRLIVFNSHGGNKAVLDTAALQLRAEHGLLVVKANYFRFTPPENQIAAEELAHGLHGGALETAMMLHLQPEQVRRDALADFKSLGATRARAGLKLGPEGEAAFAWLAEDLHPQGVAGNATSADADTGRRLVEHFAARLVRIIEEAATFDWPPGSY